MLITGGDPMIMGATVLRRYIEPLLEPGLEHIESIRIGSKALAYWPQRFVSDPDADDTLRLFEKVVASGRSLAFMAHFSHPRELGPALAAGASSRIRSHRGGDPYPGPADQDDQRRSGDLVRDVADPGPDGDGAVLHVRGAGHRPAGLLRGAPLTGAWHLQRRVPAGRGAVPHRARAVDVGDSGKVCVDGIADVAGQRVFVLHMIQARDPDLVGKPFFAHYDPDATWLTDLRPAFAGRFPFEAADAEDLPGIWSPEVFEPAS